jgi:hypothetical protein
MTATGVATHRGGFDTVIIDKTRNTQDLLDSVKNNRWSYRPEGRSLEGRMYKSDRTRRGCEKTLKRWS